MMHLLGKLYLLLATSGFAYSSPTLATVRETLAVYEDLIISSLIERAKLPKSSSWYNKNGDFVQYLQGFEDIAANLGRYDLWTGEIPFTLGYPLNQTPFSAKIVPALPSISAELFSVNEAVYHHYTSVIIPSLVSINSNSTLTENSTSLAMLVIADHKLLSILSKRIHYGKVVAEAKFISNPKSFANKNRQEVRNLLTDTTQESVVKTRSAAKTRYLSAQLTFNATLGSLLNATEGAIDPIWVGQQLFGGMLIPATTDVEVQYILSRRP